MRWLCPVGLLLVTACGPRQVEQTQLKDGSYKITCQVSMDECFRQVQDQCKNQRFRILEGTSETRLRDAPPFEKAYHTSRVHLQCTNDGADVLLDTENKDKPAAATTKPAATCSVGQTRECIGAAACKGGQSCLPDGSGFGACDCGSAAPAPAVVPAPPASSAPGEPAPSPAPPATSP